MSWPLVTKRLLAGGSHSACQCHLYLTALPHHIVITSCCSIPSYPAFSSDIWAILGMTLLRPGSGLKSIYLVTQLLEHIYPPRLLSHLLMSIYRGFQAGDIHASFRGLERLAWTENVAELQELLCMYRVPYEDPAKNFTSTESLEICLSGMAAIKQLQKNCSDINTIDVTSVDSDFLRVAASRVPPPPLVSHLLDSIYCGFEAGDIHTSFRGLKRLAGTENVADRDGERGRIERTALYVRSSVRRPDEEFYPDSKSRNMYRRDDSHNRSTQEPRYQYDGCEQCRF
ncbi:hypothetical protein B0H12DRAFT_1100642 [Mycena haematopus]|nr:hypothetical protein B0H12DRAFT_1100642 [Mycena haematopus]